MAEVYQREIVYCQKRIESITERQEREQQNKLLYRLYGSAKTDPVIRDLEIKQIICDPRCQQREQLDSEVVAEYMEVWLSGGVLPPIKVIQEGEDHWLYDGFHTLQSAKNARITTLSAEVKGGTLRDAILASVGVNANHGLRRSNATKRNAVMTLLKDEEWGKWSNYEIAEKCRVSEGLVRKIRKEHPELQSNEIIRRDKHGNISKMNIEQIGNSTNGHYEQNVVNKDDLSTIFLPDQLLQLKLTSFDGVNEDIKLLNHHYCVVTSKTEIGNAYYVKFVENNKFTVTHAVKAEDLKVVTSVSATFTFDAKDYLAYMKLYGSLGGIEAAIRRGEIGW